MISKFCQYTRIIPRYRTEHSRARAIDECVGDALLRAVLKMLICGNLSECGSVELENFIKTDALCFKELIIASQVLDIYG